MELPKNVKEYLERNKRTHYEKVVDYDTLDFSYTEEVNTVVGKAKYANSLYDNSGTPLI